MTRSSQHKPPRHLVTGGAGLIGFELTKQLLESKQSVLVIDNLIKGGAEDLAELASQFPTTLEIRNQDLADPKTLESTTEVFGNIFHFAAIVGVHYVNTHPYETARVNAFSTLNVLDLAIRTKCARVAFASSSENYASGVEAGTVPLPTPEDVTLSIADIELPRWSYAASKMFGESALFGAAKVGGFIPTVIRFHNVFGPRMGPTHVIPEFIDRCMRRMNPFPVYGYDATRSFLSVEDAAAGVLLAASAEGGIYNVGSAEEIAIADLVDLVFEVSGFRPRVEKHPAPPGSVTRRVPDISKLSALGFKPRIALRDGIASCVEYQARRQTIPAQVANH